MCASLAKGIGCSPHLHITPTLRAGGRCLCSMKLNTLEDLVVHELRGLYSGENQLIRTLPALAQTASPPELAVTFESQLAETHGHIQRLDAIATAEGFVLKGQRCRTMEILLWVGAMLADRLEGQVRDAVLLSIAQGIQQHEVSVYGAALRAALSAGLFAVADLLAATLKEKQARETKLAFLADSFVNAAVLAGVRI